MQHEAKVLTRVPVARETTGSAIADARVEAFGKALSRVREAKHAKDRAEAVVDVSKARALMAKERGDNGAWETKASDTKGRNAELLLYLDSCEEYGEQVKAYELAAAAYEEAQDGVNQLKYFQRERQVQSAEDIKVALSRFERSAAAFVEAVDVFAALRKGA